MTQAPLILLAADGANPLVPAGAELLAGAVGAVCIVLVVTAVLLLAVTRMDAYRRLLWLAVAVLVPFLGAIASIVVALRQRRRPEAA